MNPILNFNQLTSYLKSLPTRRRVAVVCPHDPHTEYAVKRALEEGFAEFLLIADKKYLHRAEAICNDYPSYVTVYTAEDMDEAARLAVRLVHEGKAEILMKGIINTDNLLRAVLDKENGLLPKGRVLSHITLTQVPSYPKLIFFSDCAVIPKPTYEQYKAMIHYVVDVAHQFGLDEPRVALIHCTEKVNPKFPHTLDYEQLKKDALDGVFGQMQIDGPMDVKTACDVHSGDIKGLSSPVVGNADVLIFPNIESGNTFYKTVSLFGRADMAGILQGALCPVVVTSRSDSSISKYYGLAFACITQNN